MKGASSTDLGSFHGDHTKCDQLNELLCEKAGFEECYDVSLLALPYVIPTNILPDLDPDIVSLNGHNPSTCDRD